MKEKFVEELKMFNKDSRSLKSIFIGSYLVAGIVPLLIMGLVCGVIIKNAMYKNQVDAMNQISSMVMNNIDRWGTKTLFLLKRLRILK